jgi:hypothetical protein
MAEKSGLDMSISVFVHYKELNSVMYDAAKGNMKIEVALMGSIEESILNKFVEKIHNSLNLYYRLSNIDPLLMNVEYTTKIGITLIRFDRDIESLSEGEIELFVLMLRENFSSLLIIDDTIDVGSEERYARKIKRSLLNKKIDDVNSKIFFGYRDHGTLFVFNK